MSEPGPLATLTSKIVAVDELLTSMQVVHQFGGAIALAWYRNPRATTDIDLNITLPPDRATPVLDALGYLGVTLTDSDRELIAEDGQARLDWDGSYLDVFFATLPFHAEMARRSREVSFGSGLIPILCPEHLVVCKAVFARPKDWVDIEAMVAWGTELDRDEVFRWVDLLLGSASEAHGRLSAVLAAR